VYPEGHPEAVSTAPLQEFYMFRATSDVRPDYAFGNLNTGNLDGVIWYLQNEVVTMYSEGTRCPRKFNISQITRYKIRTRATQELFDQHMNMGARFAYDFGNCMGRCFPNNLCTSPDDCDAQYQRYGFVVGCNNFADHYPFPDNAPQAPGGIWYSLPLEGRCSYPTGAHNCTWSYEVAGQISLEELEAQSPGNGNCCDGHCTSYWDDFWNPGRTQVRAQQARDLFFRLFPDEPRDLMNIRCDFNHWAWYTPDPYERRDPWATTTRRPT
jgi:hypothetical protein